MCVRERRRRRRRMFALIIKFILTCWVNKYKFKHILPNGGTLCANLSSSFLANAASPTWRVFKASITTFHVGGGCVLFDHFVSAPMRHCSTPIESALMIARSSALKFSAMPISSHLAALLCRVPNTSLKSGTSSIDHSKSIGSVHQLHHNLLTVYWQPKGRIY